MLLRFLEGVEEDRRLQTAKADQVKPATSLPYQHKDQSQDKNMAWVPLESNPEVMNKLLTAFGVKDVPGKWQVCDVYGVDEAMLAMVPRPVLALIFLFPYGDKYQTFMTEEVKKAENAGRPIDDNVFYLKQTVSNACGTIALIHALANNTETLNLDTAGVLSSLLSTGKNMSPDERAAVLKDDKQLSLAHASAAAEGQSEAPPPDKYVDLHFVCLVSVGGDLYELDGRKERPINHGPTSKDTFLSDAAKVAQRYMEVDTTQLRFSIMALTGTEGSM